MDLKPVLTGALIGAAAASIAWKYIAQSKEQMWKTFGDEILLAASQPVSNSVEFADALITEEQFIRNEQFFGKPGQDLVSRSRVIVVGVGGVGSHCAVTLARSGVGSLRLIDFDRVTVSSLNRHASAVRREVGIPKVTSLEHFIGSFAPECEVDVVEALFTYEAAVDQISSFQPDWVVDAIDNIHTKADLLAFCHSRKIKVVSACGSAAKCDPTRIRISSLEHSSEDPLARAVRQRLRLRHGLVNSGVPVVYSTERTSRGLLPLKDFQATNPKEFQTLDKFRVRILPVIAPLPAIMGNAIASYVLCQLAEQPFTPLATAPAGSVSFRKKLWNFLLVRKTSPLPNSPDADLILDLVYDACAGRSVVSGDASNLCLVEMDAPTRLVLMTTAEAKMHVDTNPFPLTERIEKILLQVERQFAEAR